MAIYYIDNQNGKNENTGLCESCPKADHKGIDIKPGDTVLFKRGGFYREKLVLVPGEEGKPVTFGSYGEGELPIFCSSVDLSSPGCWVEVRENVWKCTTPPAANVGNLIFGEDECTATFRWTEEELAGQGDFFEGTTSKRAEGEELLLYSVGNPGKGKRPRIFK